MRLEPFKEKGKADRWVFTGAVPMELARKTWPDRYSAVTSAQLLGYTCFANGACTLNTDPAGFVFAPVRPIDFDLLRQQARTLSELQDQSRLSPKGRMHVEGVLELLALMMVTAHQQGVWRDPDAGDTPPEDLAPTEPTRS